MIEGLKEYSQKPDFKINMSTFGDVDLKDGICVGCAATCALQKLFNVSFKPYEILGLKNRAYVLKQNLRLLDDFETCVDSIRSGLISLSLREFHFFSEQKLNEKQIEKIREAYANLRLKPLINLSWEKNLPKYEEFLLKVKEIENNL